MARGRRGRGLQRGAEATRKWEVVVEKRTVSCGDGEVGGGEEVGRGGEEGGGG